MSKFVARTMQGESGAVALLAAVIMAVLISVVTSGVTRVSSNEQHQTTDVRDSSRAYYAAEAGVEDALQRIKDHSNDPNPTNRCLYTETDGTVPADGACTLIRSISVKAPVFKLRNSDGTTVAGDPGATWIHRTIKASSQQSTGYLDKDKSVQFDLNRSGVTQIVIEWDDPSQGDPNAQQPWPTGFTPDLAAGPSTLEATMASWSADVANKVTSFNTISKYLGRACQSNATCSTDGGNSVVYQSSSQYHFKWTIDTSNISPSRVGDVITMRLRAWHAGTHYKVTAFAGGTQIDIPDQYLTIDVTGKAGDSYRRLIVKKRYQAGIFSIFDFVMASKTDLCKSFGIYNNGDPSINNCP